MTLQDLGWNAFFAEQFPPFHAQNWKPARLIRDNKITYGALLEGADEREVILGGKVWHDAETDADLPAVGDWVALELNAGLGGVDNIIRARLARQTTFSRKRPGNSTEEQVIAANVDIVVVVTEAGADFSLRRMERYFTIIGRSGAKAVVLVNKSDLFPASQTEAAAQAIRDLEPEADVHITSAQKGNSLDILRSYLLPGVTMTFIGSSGVGKSSVVNHLLGDDFQWTDEVNQLTHKGRHTTTARELLVLHEGGIIIDNPGIKEVQMWTDEAALRDRFADIAELALQCKFQNCRHGTDADCAVRTAVEEGKLDAARFEGYLKLEDEVEKLRRSQKKRQMTIERRSKREQHQKFKKYAERRDSTQDDEM